MRDCDGFRHGIDALYDRRDPDTLLRTSGVRCSNRYPGIPRFAGNRLVYRREYPNPPTVADAFGRDFSNGVPA